MNLPSAADVAAAPFFAARHSCDSPEWYTPSPYVEAAREVMGGIDLDPMSHEEANRTVKAVRFFSEAEDGMAQRWTGRVFINPPGGLVKECWRKLIDEPFDQFIWIGYSVEQLQTLQVGRALAPTPIDFAMCIPDRRIPFVENEAKKAERIAKMLAAGKKPNDKSQPSHANYISYGGMEPEKFERVFRQFGQVRL